MRVQLLSVAGERTSDPERRRPRGRDRVDVAASAGGDEELLGSTQTR